MFLSFTLLFLKVILGRSAERKISVVLRAPVLPPTLGSALRSACAQLCLKFIIFYINYRVQEIIYSS